MDEMDEAPEQKAIVWAVWNDAGPVPYPVLYRVYEDREEALQVIAGKPHMRGTSCYLVRRKVPFTPGQYRHARGAAPPAEGAPAGEETIRAMRDAP